MTLAEWKDAYKPSCSADGLSIYHSGLHRAALWDLFHLEDFFVSSVLSGPCYRLCLRISPPLVDRAYYPEDWQ